MYTCVNIYMHVQKVLFFTYIHFLSLSIHRYHFMVMFCVVLMVPKFLGPLTLKAVGQDALIENL
jgi:hypothetical protein